ncbi:MAG: hypothetical protein ACI87W_003463 [Halieaceae bacterium]|jgi:hypothetical protein
MCEAVCNSQLDSIGVHQVKQKYWQKMDSFCLLRDVVQTVDDSWRPIDAYVRLSVDETFSGAAWYRFDGCRAECHGFSSATKPLNPRA